MSRLQKRMARAGYHGVTPVIVFLASEIVTPPSCWASGRCFSVAAGAARILMAVFSAWWATSMPGLVLQRRIEQRKKIIQNGLPDALDLFIVCLEAGSSLDQAMLKTSQDLDVPYPPLASELRMITTEMRAGKPRLEAFKNFAARTGVDDVRALVSMLVQADRFGTSIAQALRTHAEVVADQAAAACRGAGREDRRQDGVPARVLPVSRVLRRHTRPWGHQVHPVLLATTRQ